MFMRFACLEQDGRRESTEDFHAFVEFCIFAIPGKIRCIMRARALQYRLYIEESSKFVHFFPLLIGVKCQTVTVLAISR